MRVTCPDCGAVLDIGTHEKYPLPVTCSEGQVAHYVWVWKYPPGTPDVTNKKELVKCLVS